MVVEHMDLATLRAVEESMSFEIENNANFAFDSDYTGHKSVQERFLSPLIFVAPLCRSPPVLPVPTKSARLIATSRSLEAVVARLW